MGAAEVVRVAGVVTARQRPSAESISLLITSPQGEQDEIVVLTA